MPSIQIKIIPTNEVEIAKVRKSKRTFKITVSGNKSPLPISLPNEQYCIPVKEADGSIGMECFDYCEIFPENCNPKPGKSKEPTGGGKDKTKKKLKYKLNK